MKFYYVIFWVLAFSVSCNKNSAGDNTAGGNTTSSNAADSAYNPVDPSVANSQGFFLDEWTAKTFSIPEYTIVGPFTAIASDTVTIDVNNVITKVPQYIYGNNANMYMTQMVDQPSLLGYIKDLAPHVIRFPGGNISSLYFWNAAKNSPPADVADTLYDSNLQPYKATASTYWYGKNSDSWTMSLDNYYSMLQTTGCSGIITINYAYARYGLSADPVATAAHYAADWVRYDKGRTKFWEIGNESGGPWQAGYKINTRENKNNQPEIITGSVYGQHFKVFVDSMRKAATEIGTTIKIGAQVVGVDPSTSSNATDKIWNAGLFATIGNYADYFIVHDYFTPYNINSTAKDILATAASETKTINNFLTINTANNSVQLKPIALTEWNIFATGSKQMVSNIAGMHAVLTLGELLNNKFGFASRWDLANAYDNGNDHGMFNNGTSEPGAPAWNPRPAFYYMYFFQKYFGDRMVSNIVQSSSTDVTCYASTFTSGQAGTVVVNKGTLNRIVAINFKHFPAGTKYYWYILSGGTDNGEFSAQVYINGVGPSTATGGPLTYASVKAYAAPLSGTIKLAVPARSVAFLVADKK
jgi:hypothetical protein